MDLTLDPAVLIKCIETVTEERLPKVVRNGLTVAISDDLGVARKLWDPTFHALLRPVLTASSTGVPSFRPTLVQGRFQKSKKKRRVRGTSAMLTWFRGEERNTGDPAERWAKDRRYRIPVPADSTALVPIGGDLTEDDVRLTTTREDGVQVKWYSVGGLQVGHIIYRVDSGIVYSPGAHADIRVTIYQKVGHNMWARVQASANCDVVDLPVMLADLAGKGNRFTRVERIEGQELHLLRPPPDRKGKEGTATTEDVSEDEE